MTPAEFRKARHKLGLSLSQLGEMLGYNGAHLKQQVHRLEIGEREIREPQRRLMQAYLDGYRPRDWPR